ncbi:KAT8 regulatory NSL complex subunit 2-like [Teleopsis dalmanni]|uniref:KAT8 regulatory NSL complex subunit 2-like n=1 Tax=Teleopsis dalmanni TaxID=139649 RepID=UPI0018CF4B6F|nr:KAT8 regulatory NSL complex subunit 2-like [Teleopsis dalmanni]
MSFNINKYNRSRTEKRMREQVKMEIINKMKQCKNSSYKCSLPCLDEYDYCQMHILNDPSSFYAQCTYLYKKRRRCPNPVLLQPVLKAPGPTTFCFEHTLKEQRKKRHIKFGKFCRPENNEILLSNLSHHIERLLINDENDGDLKNKQRHILDYASDSSGEESAPCLEDIADFNLDNSDDEDSLSLQKDDVLSNANIFSREEVLRISANKMARLRDLYVGQIKHLDRKLNELSKDKCFEKKDLANIKNMAKTSPVEMEYYKKFKALTHYHCPRGLDALFTERRKEKERIAKGVKLTNEESMKCVHISQNKRCEHPSLPATKYCREHILEDSTQILFRACGMISSGISCNEPVLNVEHSVCSLHQTMDKIHNYTI